VFSVGAQPRPAKGFNGLIPAKQGGWLRLPGRASSSAEGTGAGFSNKSDETGTLGGSGPADATGEADDPAAVPTG